MGALSAGAVTPGLCAQQRGNSHRAHLGQGGSCCRSSPPHGEAAVDPPQHPSRPRAIPPSCPPRARTRGISPTLWQLQGKGWDAPVGSAHHREQPLTLSVDQHRQQGWGSPLDEAGLGMGSSAQARPSRLGSPGWSGRACLSRSRSL